VTQISLREKNYGPFLHIFVFFAIGLAGPSSISFSPKSKSLPTYITFLSSHAPRLQQYQRLQHQSGDRQFYVAETNHFDRMQPLLRFDSNINTSDSVEDSLEEKLRRERQRQTGSGVVSQFSWVENHRQQLSILVPIKGSLFTQEGIDGNLQQIYDKTLFHPIRPSNNLTTTTAIVGRDSSAIDAQLSPDGRLVAFVIAGDIHILPFQGAPQPIRLSFGAVQDGTNAVSHGLADFVAQEEMDRYRGFWWHPDSNGILFARVDESHIPIYRIQHQGNGEDFFEDHRYPFTGQQNPTVQLGFLKIDPKSILEYCNTQNAQKEARQRWEHVTWFPPPREAQEYLARVNWSPDGSPCVQWQNRTQTTLVLTKLDIMTGRSRTLLVERSDIWINLHHMFHVLPRAVHSDECQDSIETIASPGPLPPGSFSFLFASERSGFMHLYLFTYVPGINSERAALIRSISSGDWMVESIVGVDMDADAVYITGTYDSSLERHLYALPITGALQFNSIDQNNGSMRRSLKQVMSAFSGSKQSSSRCSTEGIIPIRLTAERGMHNIVMDDACRFFVDTSSDLGRPTSVKLYKLHEEGPFSMSSPSMIRGRKMSRKLVDEEVVRLVCLLYDAACDEKATHSLLSNPNDLSAERLSQLPAPELMSFPTTDGTATLHAALYRPDPRMHGPGPYPLICAVYGGPHVQRVNRSWSQCCDMRAQRLRSLGFAVVKCDNRGSSRRGLAFEGAIQRRLGRLEVLDQVAAVRHLVQRGIADSSRIGVYGWSYGGYLAAMCLCRAPDVFHVAVAGAPVTSWDGYDTHYTERYMGLPAENVNGYRESAVFDHVPNMSGKIMIVHGLIDENVHFRHTTRLINRLIANGKDYDLLIFPDERHSPRRLRDRIYMEQRISDFFLLHLGKPRSISSTAIRNVAGHL
jgi:dipeptidyl-peptidase 4